MNKSLFFLIDKYLKFASSEGFDENLFDQYNYKFYELKKIYENLLFKIKSNVDYNKNKEELKRLRGEYLSLKDIVKNQYEIKKHYEWWHLYSSIDEKLEELDELKHIAEYYDFKKHYAGKNRFYIRFGKFPKSERSRIALDSDFIKEVLHGKNSEYGVSVYKAYPHRGKWVLVEPSKEHAQYNAKLDMSFIIGRIVLDEIYLVTGDELKSKGVDGEPLITNVFPVKKLTPKDIILSGNSTLDDYLNRLRDYKHVMDIEDPSIRKLLLTLIFIYNNEDDILFDILLEDDLDKFNLLMRTSGNLESMSKLSKEDMEFLLDIAKSYLKERNKRMVFKGYRPFY